MNIVKFGNKKDLQNPIFNNRFRDKYCYWVHCKYAFLMGDGPDTITGVEYQKLESGELKIKDSGKPYIIVADYSTYVDEEETVKANNVIKFITANTKPSPDAIDINELRAFRTWLAQRILDYHKDEYDFSCYTDNNQMILDMLQYYAGNMENCTTRSLRAFTNVGAATSISTGCGCGLSSNPSVANITKSAVHNISPSTTLAGIQKSAGCGCGSTASYVSTSTSICDPLATYRDAIYNYMVSVFSDINFWTLDDHSLLCEDMKVMIDEIIRLNFVLASYTADRFLDCTCSNPNADEQTRLMNMLKALSTALGYIIDDKVAGNRNFISKSFSDWAMFLYEKMYWL